MKNKNVFCTLALALGILAPSSMSWAQKLDKAYFKKLQTQRVTSTQKVKWTTFGPAMSGYNDEFWIHPTDSNSLYTSLDMGQCYSSQDGGENWMTTLDWDGDGEDRKIGWIDFSRQDPDFGLAFDQKGKLMVTEDRGRTFSYDYTKQPDTKKISVLAVDPSDDNNWYAGAGQIWRIKKTHRSLKHPHGTKVRYTNYGYVLISKDRGYTWEKITAGLPQDLDVARIFVHPEDSKKVFLFANRGFYISKNGGRSWKRKGKGLPYNEPRDGAMHFDKETGKVSLYLVEQTRYTPNKAGEIETTGGIYRSDDEGKKWTSITGDIKYDMNKITHYSVKKQFYRAIGYWLDMPKAKAEKQFKKLPSSTMPVWNRIIVNPLNPNDIYLCQNEKHDFSFGPGEIWKTEDGGKHWFVTARSGKYWAKGKDDAYWKTRQSQLGKNMKFAHLDHEMTDYDVWPGGRFLDIASNGDLYCVVEQQVLRSKDGGKSWNQIEDIETKPGSGHWIGKGCSNLPGENLQLRTGMNRYLFLSGEHGLWISATKDGNPRKGYAVEQLSGQSKKQYDATSICTAAVCPNDTNKLYMMMFRQSHRGHFRHSKDGGKTWENLSEPVKYPKKDQTHIRQKDLIIDKDDVNRMYFTVPYSYFIMWTKTKWAFNGPKYFKDHGIYRTLDGGKTWTILGEENGLPASKSCFRLTMDPKDSKTLYASYNHTHDRQVGGLYVSHDGGDTWKAMSIPKPIKSVNHLYVDHVNGKLYLSAGECLAKPNEGGVWVSKNKGKSWTKIFDMPWVKECYASDADPNVLIVNVGRAAKIKGLNPGIYISRNGGSKWMKANYQMGQPTRIRAVRADLRDKDVFWLALFGTGFVRGEYTD